MSGAISLAIRCGRCGGRHCTVHEVKICYGMIPQTVRIMTSPNPVQVVTQPRVSERQIEYIFDLGGDTTYALTLTRKEASNYIDLLKRKAQMVNPYTNANKLQTKVPIGLLLSTPDGRYAVRPDSDTPYTFFRISRPKSGLLKGTLKVQTQHSESYKLTMVVYSEERVVVYDTRRDEQLKLVLVDPNGAGIAYGRELGRCMRCGKELTDERSRWYSIGPECEKHAPHIIDIVNDSRGSFEQSRMF